MLQSSIRANKVWRWRTGFMEARKSTEASSTETLSRLKMESSTSGISWDTIILKELTVFSSGDFTYLFAQGEKRAKDSWMDMLPYAQKQFFAIIAGRQKWWSTRMEDRALKEIWKRDCLQLWKVWTGSDHVRVGKACFGGPRVQTWRSLCGAVGFAVLHCTLSFKVEIRGENDGWCCTRRHPDSKNTTLQREVSRSKTEHLVAMAAEWWPLNGVPLQTARPRRVSTRCLQTLCDLTGTSMRGHLVLRSKKGVSSRNPSWNNLSWAFLYSCLMTACVSGFRQRDGIVSVFPGYRKWRISFGIKHQFWLGLRAQQGAWLSMLHCLALLTKQ